jgi:putative FmdB family regulatory protein
MPTYEFLCPKGHKFSHFYKTMSTALSQLPCPQCGVVAERQLSAGVGFSFKGSGFYLTDYGKNAHRGEKAPSTAASETSGASSEKKSDSSASATAATKTESAPKSEPASKPKAESSKPKAKE